MCSKFAWDAELMKGCWGGCVDYTYDYKSAHWTIKAEKVNDKWRYTPVVEFAGRILSDDKTVHSFDEAEEECEKFTKKYLQ